jgi:hypothetical protein
VIGLHLIDNPWGLWFSTLSCTVAAAYCLVGALKGSWRHRFPRLLLAIAITGIAISYWGDVYDLGDGPVLRRAMGWLLWPSLAWTARSGLAFNRRRTAVTEATVAAINETRESD